MADLSFIFDKTKNYNDLQIVDGDFLMGDDLQTAVEISLFSDRRATDSEMLNIQGGATRISRRGYWANSFKKYAQGSAIWTLDRAKKEQTTLDDENRFATQCLQHLILEGIAKEVNVATSFLNDQLILNVSIVKPDGQGVFSYQFVWDDLEG